MALPELDHIGRSIYNKLTADNAATQEHARAALDRFDGEDDDGRMDLLFAWVNSHRSRASKRDATREELRFILSAAKTLFSLAANPLTASPSIHGSFKHTHTVTETAEDDGIPTCSPALVDAPASEARFRLYMRVRTYTGSDEVSLLRKELVDYANAYPARLPWAKALLDELNKPEYGEPSGQVSISYAGQTTESGKATVERLLDDLKGTEHVHFQNFVRSAAKTRRSINAPPAQWQFFEYRESVACDPVDLRSRFDLQAAEIALISSLLSFSLNSAFGGFHHLDFFPQHHPADPSLLLSTPCLPLPDALRRQIRAHCEDVRRTCDTIPNSGPKISDPAFAAVKRQATDLRAVGNGFTLSITIGKDITHEEMKAKDVQAGFWGRNAGPGPAWFLFARQCAMAALDVIRYTARWVALVGGFWDFWTVIIVHVHVFLSLLFIIRYIFIARPLFIRVKSAKMCNLFLTGALADVILETAQNRSTLERFWSCQVTSFTLLRLCVKTLWIDRVWVELVPPGWIDWIGEVVVCQVGPTDRDWALVCLMGHDGRLKYDPSLQIPLARLHSVVHRIAVITEEMVHQKTVSEPPTPAILKLWLIDLRKEVIARLGAEGLIAERNQARKDVAELQRWLGRNRYKDSFLLDQARSQAEEEGRLEEFDADLHERRSGAATRAAEFHLRAIGAKQSVERLAQIDAAFATLADLEERGLATLHSPFPRPRGYDDAAWRYWWLTRKAGCDLVQAAKGQDRANAAAVDYDPEASMVWFNQSGLAAWIAANRPGTSEWRSVLTLTTALSRQLDGRHLATTMRDRIMTCVVCGSCEITGKNGLHKCAEAGEESWTRDVRRGVNGVKIYDVQQLLHHPEVGLKAWKAAKKAELEQALQVPGDIDDASGQDQEGPTIDDQVSSIWQAELAKLHIHELPRSLVASVLEKMLDRWSWIDTSMASLLPLPLYKLDESEAVQIQSIVTQLGHSLISLSARMSPDTLLPCALDLSIDDTELYEPNRFRALKLALMQRTPIHNTICDAPTPCAFIGSSHFLGRQMQHHCHDGTRRNLALGDSVAFEFAELSEAWQHRIWCHVRDEGGVMRLSNWKATRSATGQVIEW